MNDPFINLWDYKSYKFSLIESGGVVIGIYPDWVLYSLNNPTVVESWGEWRVEEKRGTFTSLLLVIFVADGEDGGSLIGFLLLIFAADKEYDLHFCVEKDVRWTKPLFWSIFGLFIANCFTQKSKPIKIEKRWRLYIMRTLYNRDYRSENTQFLSKS